MSKHDMTTVTVSGPRAVPGIPADIAEWLGAVRLTQLAADAVRSVPLPAAGLAPSSDQPPPETLLAVFTYGLARGVAESEELERRARQEPGLRHLCGAHPPSALTLRNFRRHHSPAIESALTRVLGACWQGCEGEAGINARLADEARVRLRESIRADSLAQDD